MKGVIVIGTDTGVGKTFVAAGLAWALRKRGIDVGVMKPVQCGRSAMGASDAALLRKTSGTSDAVPEICPYHFDLPLAPVVAADRRGVRIALSRLTLAFRRLATRHEFLVVEGIGGLMVPLTATQTTLDWIESLGLPLLLVIANRLGAINHTLLTLHAAEARGLMVQSMILNHLAPRRSLAERTNTGLLKRLLPKTRLAEVPYLNSGSGGPKSERPAWETVGSRLERSGILEALLAERHTSTRTPL